MRVKSDEFRKMIREIVLSEMKEIVAQTISEVLSERYLRKIVSEASRTRRSELEETLIGQSHEPPQKTPADGEYENNDEGVYQQHAIKKESRKKTIDRDGVMSLFFEGTEPLDVREEEVQEGVQLPQNLDEQAARFRVLVEGSQSRRPIPTNVDPADVERRLAQKRAALEVPVRQTPQPPTQQSVDLDDVPEPPDPRLRRSRPSLESLNPYAT